MQYNICVHSFQFMQYNICVHSFQFMRHLIKMNEASYRHYLKTLETPIFLNIKYSLECLNTQAMPNQCVHAVNNANYVFAMLCKYFAQTWFKFAFLLETPSERMLQFKAVSYVFIYLINIKYIYLFILSQRLVCLLSYN